MTLNDREKFILHLVALLTMQHFGMFKDAKGLHELVRKNSYWPSTQPAKK